MVDVVRVFQGAWRSPDHWLGDAVDESKRFPWVRWWVGDWQSSEFYDAYINAAFLRPSALGCDTLEKLLLTFVVQQKQRVGGLVGGSSPTPIVRGVFLDVAE
jgi:hypothetical protein